MNGTMLEEYYSKRLLVLMIVIFILGFISPFIISELWIFI